MSIISISEKRVIEAAIRDDAGLCGRLVAEPRPTVERLLGRSLPAGTEIRVHVETEEPVYYFAVPAVGAAIDIPEPLTRRHVFENVLLEAAARDDGEMRRRAAADPIGFFRALTDNVPENGVAARGELLVDDAATVHIVVPKASESITDELPDDLMDFVSGGSPSPCNSRAGQNSGNAENQSSIPS
ncbi:MAG: hypothetical protein HQL41_13385 [Alphaproteobacteria bacterium]|nr:hypothetical protein [Alphaproteobacteria bacterium]